jgi:hypothetical protein
MKYKLQSAICFRSFSYLNETHWVTT